MSRSSTSSSEHVTEAAGDRPTATPEARHRRTRSIVAWSVAFSVLFLLAAEVGTRAMGDLPANRTWPDVESQYKAEHAEAVAASEGREPLIFAGSSVSDAAFDPAIVTRAAGTDSDSFNYAQEGSLAATTARFLDAAVIDQVDPDVVVLGVFPGDIGASPTNAAALGDELAASRGYRLASGNPTVADRIDDAASSRSALIAHREILRDPVRLLQWLRAPSTPTILDADTGALLRHRDQQWDPDQATGGDLHAGDATVPVAPQVQAIEDLAEELAARGTRLVVVELPVLEDSPAAPDEAARSLTHAAMVDIEASGCAERLDLRSVGQDVTYWSDPVHVNEAGTELVSKAVGEWLAQNPDAPEGC